MLSILIPTYNYNAYPLAKELERQALIANVDFELICIDDGSGSDLNNENFKISTLKHSTFIANKVNLGRSGIRNLLAQKAKFDFLLFLDSDVQIFRSNFLNTYLNSIDKSTNIIYGGIVYQKEKPNDNQLLRWTYGNKREALKLEQRLKNPHLTFLTLNFIIRKSVFEKIKFNEEMPNLRNEDLVFAMDAKRENVVVKHINNPVIHLGIETSEVFLSKTNETLHSFKTIIEQGILNPDDAKITRLARILTKLKLSFIFNLIWKVYKKSFKNNLLSNNPSLYIFDLYRLCYYLRLNNKS